MEVESADINIDEFLPSAKAKSTNKRDLSEGDGNIMEIEDDCESGTKTKPIKAKKLKSNESRKITVPLNRLTALKENWIKLITPVVENLQLQIRFAIKNRTVQIRLSPETPDVSNLQRAADYVKAFIVGFDIEDALALIRLDDLFIESFEVKDVKTLRGDHMSRAIGRLAGKGGRTKFTIENVTKTRIVLADSKIHVLGSYQNIQLARRAICNLILGSPPSKVYGNLRSVASRISARI